MIGTDGLISGSPCSASVIRTCGTTMVLDGVASNFQGFESLSITPALVLADGILGTQICCQPGSCIVTGLSESCATVFGMTCVADSSNIICVPFDQANAQTYALEIVQDGHNCQASVPTTVPISTPTSAKSKPINKGAVIGGVIGGVVGLLIVLGICIGACNSKGGGNAVAAGGDAGSVVRETSVRGSSYAGSSYGGGSYGGSSFASPLTEVDQATFSNSMRHIHRINISILTQVPYLRQFRECSQIPGIHPRVVLRLWLQSLKFTASDL
jgi:hypothetical protein